MTGGKQIWTVAALLLTELPQAKAPVATQRYWLLVSTESTFTLHVVDVWPGILAQLPPEGSRCHWCETAPVSAMVKVAESPTFTKVEVTGCVVIPVRLQT
jgi:hypothetical protein